MALNALDGMLAREFNQKSRLGAVLNELGDVVSDTALYLPIALVPGVNSALVGWHHPYCRILGDELTNCFAIPSSHSSAALADEARAKREGLWPTVIELLHVEFLNLKDMLHSSGEPA